VVLSQVRVCVPQLPQLCDAGPVHVWLPHALHVQLPPHDCVPPVPHVCVAFGAHAPSPVQAAQADQVPVVLSHVRVCEPQLPHGCEAAPVQAWLPQAVHLQLPPHDCMPPLPQACVVFGAHSPSAVHIDQVDHVPVLVSHVRVCVPQLPQAWEVGPDGQLMGFPGACTSGDESCPSAPAAPSSLEEASASSGSGTSLSPINALHPTAKASAKHTAMITRSDEFFMQAPVPGTRRGRRVAPRSGVARSDVGTWVYGEGEPCARHRVAQVADERSRGDARKLRTGRAQWLRTPARGPNRQSGLGLVAFLGIGESLSQEP